MFDVGFWEIIFILVVALLVVGPERLPRVARTAGLWLGKMRGFVTSVKADIDRELATEELKRSLQKQAAMPELEEIIEETTTNLLAEEKSAGTAAKDAADAADQRPEPPGNKEQNDKET